MIKLFYRCFIQAFCLIGVIYIPIIHASISDVKLEWTAAPAQIAEVEISKASPDNVILKKQINKNFFVFKAPSLGRYLWRVRVRGENEWSPYSEFHPIDVKDKVELIEDSLMVSPKDGTIYEMENENLTLNFRWKEPYPEFQYFLEIYKDPKKRPFKVIKVSNSKKTFKLQNKKSTYWWRIIAVSPYKNRSKVQDLYQFDIVPISQKSHRSKKIIHAEVLQVSSTFSQESDSLALQRYKKSTSFTGQGIGLIGEFWPENWSGYGVLAGLEYRNLTGPNSTYKELEYVAELGKVLSETRLKKHKVYFGIHQSQIELTTNSPALNYVISYGSGRYFFESNLSEKLFFNLSTEILIPLQIEFIIPSVRLRPSLKYVLTPLFSIQGIVDYERNVAEPTYDYNGESGTFLIDYQNFMFGLGASFNF